MICTLIVSETERRAGASHRPAARKRGVIMRNLILSAVAALGLCLGAAAPARAQYYWQQYYYSPNTAYAYSYVNPEMFTYPYSTYYSPYVTGYYNPYVTGYAPGTQYYYWNSYNPYTNQYRTWRWFRRY
jgi:hypothetical protein